MGFVSMESESFFLGDQNQAIAATQPIGQVEQREEQKPRDDHNGQHEKNRPELSRWTVGFGKASRNQGLREPQCGCFIVDLQDFKAVRLYECR